MFFHRVKLFTLFGFQVSVDASWLLLGALIAWTLAVGVFPQSAPDLAPSLYWLMAIAATIGLLLSIVFHETAHSLVARRYGIEIRGITLFIFGGVAEMEGEPKSARGEFFMAMAGPLASFALAAALFALSGLVPLLHGPDPIATVLRYLALLNGMLAAFNLIPAFPLDGGRMLRAALWGWRGNIVWATRVASGAGDAFGLLLIILGVLEVLRGDFIGGMWQFLIGMFLRGAAGAGYQQTMAQRALMGVSVEQIMTRRPVAVPPNATVAEFVEDYVFRHHHREFPVAEDGLLMGVVGTGQAAALDRTRWAVTRISEVARACSAADTIAPEAAALDAMAQMTRERRSRLFVVRDGRLAGVLSQRDMIDLLSVKLDLAEALEAVSAPPTRAA